MTGGQTRRPAGQATGGQFSALLHAESEVRLDPGEEFLRRHAAEMDQRLLDDVRSYAATYRQAATFRDQDYIGSANLSYAASQVAEIVGDERTLLRVEDACAALDEDPGDVAARDECAAVIRAYAKTL